MTATRRPLLRRLAIQEAARVVAVPILMPAAARSIPAHRQALFLFPSM